MYKIKNNISNITAIIAAFLVDKGLSLDGKTSVREFVELTKDSCGGKIIKKLPIVYGME